MTEATRRATTTDDTSPKSFVLGFHGVRYQVSDVSRSVAFYTDCPGFRTGYQHLPSFANVWLGNFQILLSGPGASGSRPIADGNLQQPGGWNRVVLRVEDLPALIETARKAGFSFRNAMEVGPGGRQSKSKIQTVIRLNYLNQRDNARKPWRWQTPYHRFHRRR